MYRSSPIIRWRRYNDRYKLEGNQCSKCQKLFYPKNYLCECGSQEFKSFQFLGKGELLTFTEIKSGGEVFATKVPYCLGIIQLSEGPKITSMLADCDLKDLKIGMKMIASFRKFYSSGEKGAIHYGTKFVPEF
ncbi:MAG: Zn-ribbon domain-containing OB-fold protein [Candidatus Diapherotrites archaeon]|nr:Zn-ribbon domain-containing OB-fold protein [Candidatus Diapherotrites archaeon]